MSGNERAHRFIMRTMLKLFPILHKIVHREKDARPVQTKTEALAVIVIGSYLRRAKSSTKSIVEFAYDKSGSDKAV